MKKVSLLCLFFFFSSYCVQSQVSLYGITYKGGKYGSGTLFEYTPLGTVSVLHNYSFSENNVGLATSSLILGVDSDLYGMTQYGGNGDVGSIFKFTTSGTYIDLYDFSYSVVNGGLYPLGSLIQASDGNFYGMTNNGGGLNYDGTIFKYSLSVGLSNIFNYFADPQGEYPFGNLIQAKDGNLYGMTLYGGRGLGDIFKCSTMGIFSNLVSFNGTNGSYPLGSLIQAFDGNLYGLTPTGGSFTKYGTLFKCTTSGTLTVLVNFNDTNGSTPNSNLIQASDSNLYGVTSKGGISDSGTLFRCTTAGTLTTLVHFNRNIGYFPYGSLIQASDGFLYGMTSRGGTSDSGIIFKCSLSGVLTILASLNNSTGGFPCGNLLEAKTIIPAGIEQLTKLTEINIYPSPNNGRCTVSLNSFSAKSTIKIFNIFGVEIYDTKLNPSITHIDLSNNASGVYLYKVITEAGDLVSEGKMIIQK